MLERFLYFFTLVCIIGGIVALALGTFGVIDHDLGLLCCIPAFVFYVLLAVEKIFYRVFFGRRKR
jgi:hypothetical protein